MKKRIAILGAGPAGLALAWKLLERADLDLEIKIIEKEALVGGLASGFEQMGLFFDFSSHRLAPCLPDELQQDLSRLKDVNLLQRITNDRILLDNQFRPFPLQPDASLQTHPAVLSGLFRRLFKKRNPATYADVMLARYGRGFCEKGCFPLTRKMWGLEPAQLSARLAGTKRTSDRQWKPGKHDNRFLYPDRGFAAIFDELMNQLWGKGARFLLMHNFIRLSRNSDGRLTCVLNNGSQINFDLVFSTIPLQELLTSIQQIQSDDINQVIENSLQVPADVLAAAQAIRYRSLILCCLILNTPRWSPWQAQYFPDSNLIFSRISELKNYSGSKEPPDKTGLCIEIPCYTEDQIWAAAESEITDQVINDLAKAGLPLKEPVLENFIRRAPYAWPVPDLAMEERFTLINRFLATIPGLAVLGQHGLCTPLSIPGVMALSYRAADWLQQDLSWDRAGWQKIVQQFRGEEDNAAPY